MHRRAHKLRDASDSGTGRNTVTQTTQGHLSCRHTLLRLSLCATPAEPVPMAHTPPRAENLASGERHLFRHRGSRGSAKRTPRAAAHAAGRCCALWKTAVEARLVPRPRDARIAERGANRLHLSYGRRVVQVARARWWRALAGQLPGLILGYVEGVHGQMDEQMCCEARRCIGRAAP